MGLVKTARPMLIFRTTLSQMAPLEMNVSQSVTLAVSRLGALQQGRHSGVCERNGILVSVKPGDVGALNVNVRHLTDRLVRTCDVQCHDFHSTVGAPSDSALFVVKDTWAPESLCATLLCMTTAPNNSKLGLASRNPCKIAAGVRKCLACVSEDLSRKSTLRGACVCPRVMSATRDVSSLVLDSSGPQSSHAVVHVGEGVAENVNGDT